MFHVFLSNAPSLTLPLSHISSLLPYSLSIVTIPPPSLIQKANLGKEQEGLLVPSSLERIGRHLGVGEKANMRKRGGHPCPCLHGSSDLRPWRVSLCRGCRFFQLREVSRDGSQTMCCEGSIERDAGKEREGDTKWREYYLGCVL